MSRTKNTTKKTTTKKPYTGAKRGRKPDTKFVQWKKGKISFLSMIF